MRRAASGLAVAAALVAGACGSDSPKAAPVGATTMDVTMRDIAFAPKILSVPAGKPVTFLFHNIGKLEHEAVLGDAAVQDEHEHAMGGGGDMAGMHRASQDVVTVKPGATGRLTHTFRAGDQLLIGCHQPGHYAAGMRITIDVKD
jgi:uncharacterized cupredoxin-like copper-binding protein